MGLAAADREHRWLAIIVLVGAHFVGGEVAGAAWETGVALTPQQGHTGPVSSVAFCADGRLLVTAGIDGTARLWEVSSGREVRAFNGQSLALRAVDCSPKGDFFAAASEDGMVRLWDVATGKERLRLMPGSKEEGPITAVAIAPDGQALLSGSFNGWIHLWDAVSGAELRSWRAHQLQIPSLAFSPDGTLAASASFDTSVRLWDVRTGEKRRQWNKHEWFVTTVQFSPGGKALLSAGFDKTARLWSLETGAEIRRFGDGFEIHSARFSPDGTQILAVGQTPDQGGSKLGDGAARLWETATGREVSHFSAPSDPFLSLALSPDGRMAALGFFNGRVQLKDLRSGKAKSLGALVGLPLVAAASPSGRLLLTGGATGDLKLWDLAVGRPKRCFAEYRNERMLLRSAAFLDDETALVVGEWRVDLWSLAACQRIRSIGAYSRSFASAALAADRHVLLTGNADGTATVWDAERDEPLRQLSGHQGPLRSVALAPDGKSVLTGGSDGQVRLWNLETGEELRRFLLSHVVSAVAFSPDGAVALAATANEPTKESMLSSLLLRFNHESFAELTERGGEVRLWAVNGWREIFRTALYPISSAAFSEDGREVLVGASDGTAVLFAVPSGCETGRFVSDAPGLEAAGFLGRGSEVFTAGLDGFVRLWDGRLGRELVRLVSFLEEDWAVVAADGRFDTNNPGELAGLSWVVSDDPTTPVPIAIFLREYFEPRLLPRTLRGEQFPPIPSIGNLNRVQPEVLIAKIEAEEGDAERVRVTVEVAAGEKTFRSKGASRVQRSGAKEVRLFRDGRLVGTGRPDRPDGTATVTFQNVQLPHSDDPEIEFSAYAFNSDGVKSETVRRSYRLPSTPREAPRRAYLIHVGIDRFEEPTLDLRFAANDARALRDVLVRRMSGVSGFTEIVPVLLVSGDILPTKARIASVLRVLAGKTTDRALLAGVPGADRLRPAGPEDFVLITFSSHGETDDQGRFYLVPYDTGHRSATALDPRRLISAAELADWLREIDAGEIAMIVDACRSAASVASEGFKPGPTDSRSLGQLAYDKRMRILAATQVADFALESDLLRHGFLTYALVREGIEEGRADHDPVDGEITLGEWLRFGEQRVPALYSEVQSRRAPGRGVMLLDPLPAAARGNQLPTLFDFSLETTASPVVVARTSGVQPHRP